MGISVGSTAIADVKLGSTQVDKVYLGYSTNGLFLISK